MLKLRPQGAGDLLPNAGHLAHAALLHWFAQVDPALSARLHESNAGRPFTCSSLWFPNEREVALAQRENRHLPILPGQVYWLRLTLLRDELFQTLTTRFFQPVARTRRDDGQLALDLPSLRLGGIIFEVAELMALPADRDGQKGGISWAGYTSYERLVEQARALDLASPAAQHIGLEFRSPTAFSDGQVAWGKRMHLFPDPDRVFDRLARVWNEWAPSTLALDALLIQQYAREWIVVAQHELTTRLFHFDRYSQVGFTGTCLYRLMDVGRRAGPGLAPASSDQRGSPAPGSGRAPTAAGAGLAPAQALHLLAEFAFYAGVGQKTAMGMGQARPLRQAGMLHSASRPVSTGSHHQHVESSRDMLLAAPVTHQEAPHDD
jgi:CRISPR-associated endoribonuclease Cas6